MQHTIKNTIRCDGVGLHTGKLVRLALKPAQVNTGIVFLRSDVEGMAAVVPASYHNVVETTLGTNVANHDGVKVATIEHLMAAIWGAGVDNMIIEIDGPEVPIMDGSAEPFVFLIECAGVVEQEAPRKILKILKPIEVHDGDCHASFKPASGFVVEIEIDFNNSVVGKQKAVFDFSRVGFKSTVSRARTFGFEYEVNSLREMGLAKGGSLDNAIVVASDKILNADGLRYQDEFVRHKILDCVGDIFTAGFRIEGRFSGYKSGHSLNNKLLRKLFADESAWTVVSADIEENSVERGFEREAAYI